MSKGHCKHGEFELTEGCPQCIAERQAAQEREDAEVNSPDNIAKRIKEADVKAMDHAVANNEPWLNQAPPVSIVKVRFVNHNTGEPEGREYSYFTAEPLGLGFNVKAPTQHGFTEAKVTAVDVPEAEVAAFRDKVKTIPAGSIMVRPVPANLFPEIETTEVELPAAKTPPVAQVASLFDPKPDPNAWRTGDEEVRQEEEGPYPPALVTIETQVGKPAPELLQLYMEAASLLQFAKDRVITTNEDLKPATNDLAIILTCRKAMEARKKEIVGPIRAKLDLVQSAFNDIMFPVKEADRLTKDQVAKFDAKQRAQAAEAKRIEEEKYRLAQEEAKLNGTGEITVPLGTAQAPPVQEVTRTNMGTLSGRSNWKARVVDFKALPDEYKLPNESMLNAYARTHKGEGEILGVEFYDDRNYSVRTKG